MTVQFTYYYLVLLCWELIYWSASFSCQYHLLSSSPIFSWEDFPWLQQVCLVWARWVWLGPLLWRLQVTPVLFHRFLNFYFCDQPWLLAACWSCGSFKLLLRLSQHQGLLWLQRTFEELIDELCLVCPIRLRLFAVIRPGLLSSRALLLAFQLPLSVDLSMHPSHHSQLVLLPFAPKPFLSSVLQLSVELLVLHFLLIRHSQEYQLRKLHHLQLLVLPFHEFVLVLFNWSNF